MSNMIFPLITDFELKLPIYLESIGCHHTQEHIIRQTGYPFFQWIQCRKGSGKLLINDKSFIIEENQGMLLYPNIPHEYYALKEPWEVDWISIGGFAAESIFKNAGFTSPGVFYISQPDVLLQGTTKSLDIAKSDNPMKSLECSKIIYELIMNIISYTSTDKADFKMNQYSKLKPVFDYINNNYNKIITLQDLSAAANLTPQYLCSLFKKITGIRVFEYINSIRIKNSKEMIIRYKDLPLKDIAQICGYDNVSYFCEIFKKIEKLTPGEFRKLHGI